MPQYTKKCRSTVETQARKEEPNCQCQRQTLQRAFMTTESVLNLWENSNPNGDE